jgi:hypothetical protein
MSLSDGRLKSKRRKKKRGDGVGRLLNRPEKPSSGAGGSIAPERTHAPEKKNIYI